jgi:hypothetical protein
MDSEKRERPLDKIELLYYFMKDTITWRGKCYDTFKKDAR